MIITKVGVRVYTHGLVGGRWRSAAWNGRKAPQVVCLASPTLCCCVPSAFRLRAVHPNEKSHDLLS
eukprot:2607145-Amphidinium_carterae.1